MNVARGINRIAKRPVESIQAIIAVASMVFGLYAVSPFYNEMTENSSIARAFQDSMTQRSLVGLVFFILPALPTFLGFFFKKFQTEKWRGRSALYLFIGISFLTILRLVTVGVTPLIWVWYAAHGLVAAVLYLYWQDRVT